MTGKSDDYSSGEGGLWAGLLIVFVALKLTGVVDWPWWAVLMPLWIPIVTALVFIALAGFILSGICVWVWWSER